MQAPNTSERATRLAKTLRSILRKGGAAVPLPACQSAIAAGFGRRSWHDLIARMPSADDGPLWDAANAIAGLPPAIRAMGREAMRRLAAVAEPSQDLAGRIMAEGAEIGLDRWARHLPAFAETRGCRRMVNATRDAIEQEGVWLERAMSVATAGGLSRSDRERDLRRALVSLASDPGDPAWPALVITQMIRMVSDREVVMRLRALPKTSDMTMARARQATDAAFENVRRKLADMDADDMSGIAEQLTIESLVACTDEIARKTAILVGRALGMPATTGMPMIGAPGGLPAGLLPASREASVPSPEDDMLYDMPGDGDRLH